MKLWYGTKQTVGLDSYLFFLCILTGIATTIHQVVMASDSQSQRHAHPHPLSHAEPQNLFPGDTSIAGNECARIISAKLLRKTEALRCVTNTFVKAALLSVDIIKYQVTKWCQV